MTAHDDSAGDVARRPRQLDWLLPAAADYRELVERLPLIVYVDAPDPGSASLYISPQTTGVLGYTPEDWSSSPGFFLSILHPEDRERVVAQTATSLATGEHTTMEYRVLRRDGSVAWIYDENVVVRDEAGTPVCMQGYLLDVTELREHEAALRQSEARTQSMLDAALDGVISIDHRGVIIELNPAAEGMFGCSRDAAIGRKMVDLIVPHDLRAAHQVGFERYLATGVASILGKRIEVSALRTDGSEFPMELSIATVDVPGEPVFTAYMRDISEQKRREAALLESEAIVNSSFHAIVGRTIDGIVTSWNAAAERMFGYTAAEMLGRSVTVLSPPERSSDLEQINAKMRRGEVLAPFEAVRMHKDGRRFDVESTISPIIGASGDIVGVSAITRDITVRKRSLAVASAQAQLLEFIASGADLPQVLDRLTRFVEEHATDELLASILLLDRDGEHLRHGAAPSLPAFYCEAIDGVAIGPKVGSCGTAAYRREQVCVSDIATDPLWSDFTGLALEAGLGACWSSPFFATDGRLLGTFALYDRRPRADWEDVVGLVGVATHLAAIAIERAQAGEAARASEDRYRDLFENANEPIAAVTMDETITEVNLAFERMLGYTRAELLGTNLASYTTSQGHEDSRRATARKLSGEVSGTTYEQEFITKAGHSAILEVSSRVIEEDGRPVGIQGICRDITVRKQTETELRRLSELNRHQAMHDSLTGLPNRASFRERVELAIDVAGTNHSELAVLLMDLDRFKEINDTLGHHYGDQLLIELATRLGSVLRPSESAARLGGDEFGILITHLSDETSSLEQTLEKIHAALEHPFQVDGLPLHVEASIGVARYPEHGHDVDLLLQRADVAMYLAKDSGMPHASYTAELDHHDTASLTLLAELPRALRNRELVLHYQPKLDLHTGTLAGIEALIRWQHPTRGLIPPIDFVPAAEKTGLIQPLTRYVLDEALGELKRWQLEGHEIAVAVNLSMRNLHDPTLPQQVAELLHKWDLPGECLTLEITESAIVSDPGETKDIIRQLRELSVGIAIDDFGTGYTSLAYLARLPITQLKIDRSFVMNMDNDAADAAIVRSIITLGHDLDLEVVAEGVESVVIHDQLVRLGCDSIQGYWLSRPLPPAELSEWLGRAASHPGERAA